MKCSITASDLAAALKPIKPLCSSSGLPILGTVLLEAGDTSLSLFATNLDQSLCVTIGAKVAKPGKVCVPCSRLLAAASKIDGELLELTSDKLDLICEGERMRCRLHGMDPEEFPPQAKMPAATGEFEFEPGILGASLAKVLPFVSDDSTRYSLCGVFVCSKLGKLSLVATDGRRLAMCDPLPDDEEEAEADFGIIPAEAVKRIIALDHLTEPVSVQFSESIVRVACGNWDLRAKLIEGAYPNYQQVIPKKVKRWFSVGREAMKEMLPFVEVCSSKSSRCVKIAITDGRATFSSSAAEVGDASVELEADTPHLMGPGAFSPAYLMDAVDSMTGDKMRFEMADDQSPLALRPVSPGCANCYAAALSKRTGGPEYRKGAVRLRTRPENWRQPLRWNREAVEQGKFKWKCPCCRNLFIENNPDFGCDACALHGKAMQLNPYIPTRPRVFCASLADWLDDEVPIEWLADLLALIHATPNLDWLLLTKRPGNWRRRMLSVRGVALERNDFELHSLTHCWLDRLDIDPPSNIWIGTTVENQDSISRHKSLMDIPAQVHFWSSEPMLSDIKAGHVWDLYGRPDWVICGGESGPKARPMHPEWARSLRNQCEEAGVPFLFKQWGEWLPFGKWYIVSDCATGKGKDLYSRRTVKFDSGLEISGKFKRFCFDPDKPTFVTMHKVGKKAAGRLLDGKEHSAFPR